AASFWPNVVDAAPFTHTDIQISNNRLAASAGTINWLQDWELTASASSFDTVNGFSSGSQFATGQPATASASAVGAFSSASASAGVDSSGLLTSLQASSDVMFSSGVFASSFATASAYRDFEIDGGSGLVNVNLGFDYLAHLVGDQPGAGSDFRAVL